MATSDGTPGGWLCHAIGIGNWLDGTIWWDFLLNYGTCGASREQKYALLMLVGTSDARD